jgi:hypothetical protein
LAETKFTKTFASVQDQPAHIYNLDSAIRPRDLLRGQTKVPGIDLRDRNPWTKVCTRFIASALLAGTIPNQRTSSLSNFPQLSFVLLVGFVVNTKWQTVPGSNATTAIAGLINSVNVGDAFVTIDAAGCEKNVAKKIVEANADYEPALQGNQGTMVQRRMVGWNDNYLRHLFSLRTL